MSFRMSNVPPTSLSSNGLRPSSGTTLTPSGQATPGTPSSVYIRISIPEKGLQKCLQFQPDEPVSVAKHTILMLMGQDLVDPLNYGVYWPPMAGRNGKFLQEERSLSDYSLPGPIGFLEFRYKRRCYSNIHYTVHKLKKLHTKSNLRQFLDYVKAGDVAKVSKWLSKGIDPNYHCKDSGETPLTMASKREKPRELIMALVSGGAHLDFRARDSMTPLHKAGLCGNYEAIRTLLDLGQSPNCRDIKGLTPLYYTVAYDTRPICTERLLFDRSMLGITDEHGLQEIHQACRYGRVHHLEHLVAYRADLNSTTRNGNSPLHICALTEQEACARLLLFRGCRRELVNNNGQTPYEIALLSRHNRIADLIKGFRDEDIVELKQSPRYNARRRITIPSLRVHHRSSSLNRLPDFSQLDDPSMPTQKPSRPVASSVSPGLAATMVGMNKTLGSSSTLSRSVNDLTDVQGQGQMGNGTIGGLSDAQLSYRAHNPQRTHPVNQRSSVFQLLNVDLVNFPRSVVLQRGPKGFGFVLRGATDGNNSEFIPTRDAPARQYFENIQPGSPADKAGLKGHDYVLEINGVAVVTAFHEEVVDLIRGSGDTLAMKVITVDKSKMQQQAQVFDQLDQTLAEFDDSTSLRSYLTTSTDKTASIRSRPYRPIPDGDNADVRPRDLPYSPPMPVMRMFDNESEIRAKLRANSQYGQQHKTSRRIVGSHRLDGSLRNYVNTDDLGRSNSTKVVTQEPSQNVASRTPVPMTAPTGRAVTFAQDRIYEKAVEFLERNPGARVLVTSSGGEISLVNSEATNKQQRVCVVPASSVSVLEEPAPDYPIDDMASESSGSTAPSVMQQTTREINIQPTATTNQNGLARRNIQSLTNTSLRFATDNSDLSASPSSNQSTSPMSSASEAGNQSQASIYSSASSFLTTRPVTKGLMIGHFSSLVHPETVTANQDVTSRPVGVTSPARQSGLNELTNSVQSTPGSVRPPVATVNGTAHPITTATTAASNVSLTTTTSVTSGSTSQSDSMSEPGSFRAQAELLRQQALLKRQDITQKDIQDVNSLVNGPANESILQS